MKLNYVLLLFFIIFTSGCTTLHFDNGQQQEASVTKEEWHHNVVLALFEVSDPVNLKEECGDKQWTSVQTELTFANGFVSTLVNIFLPVWYPKTVEVSCS